MNNYRRREALRLRIEAAELAAGRVHPRHMANGDEQKFRHPKTDDCSPEKKNKPSYLASFTKGLLHEYSTGLICNSEDFQQFIKGIDSGDPRDFRDTPLGPNTKDCGHDDCGDKPCRDGDKCCWKSPTAQNINKD
ncbi:MAG: hypothetical protein D3914_17390, partial [Candidatus Electrothrix sp. LOE2]|nr:hypothetical protein [Candidatus Electrothrix sp. LOE2]